MKKIIVIVFTLLSLVAINTVQAFDQMIVFGDSLSDEGYQDQNPNLPVGKTPVWTSPGGHTWVYYLAQDMGIAPPQPNNKALIATPDGGDNYASGTLDGTDYAAGGATSDEEGYSPTSSARLNYNPPSLIEQICQYTTGGIQTYSQCTAPTTAVGDPKALYSIFIGANDIFTAFTNPDGKTFNCNNLTDSLANQVVSNVVWSINKLQSTSATPLHIVVVGLPDIGTTPLGRFTLPLNGCQASRVSGFIAQLNTQESVAVSAITTSQVLYLDTFSMTDSLRSHYPFTNANMAACPIQDGQSAFLCIPTEADASTYMFEDAVHPTALTHSLFAAQFYSNLKGAGWVS